MFQRIALFFQSPTLPLISCSSGEVNRMAKIQNLAHGTVPHLYLKMFTFHGTNQTKRLLLVDFRWK